MKRASTCRIDVIAVTLFCIFSVALQAQVNITTYHNDNARTGQNTQETILTPANVNAGQFGKLFSFTVDGWVYAQPLYLSNVTIGGGTHNVLYVATEHDSLYAIDADKGTIYWHISLIPAGGSTVNSSSDLGCGDLVPEIGITGTPVIDTTTGTLYVVAKSKVSGSLVQYLHAIDIASSAEKFGGPIFIQATVPGTASDGNGTTVSFSPHFENQRAGLLLENGHVLIGWSSHCDINPWHGWIMSYSASTLAQEAAFNTSADGSANGVWMSGGGLAADSNGNIFFATGNGTWNGTTDYGDSIVKLGPPSGGTFPVLDYFTPYNQSSLAGGDTDVASGGLVLLPALPSNQQLLTQMGKEGKIYVIDRNNMGKYCVNDVPPCNGNDPNIVQEIPGATAGVWGSPAYWNGSVYWGGGSDGGGPDHLKAFSFNANNSGQISASPTSESSKAFSFSAPIPTISANGISNGILWGLDNSAFGSSCSGGSNCQVLYAYDATNLANLLYTSSQAANNRDVPGGAVKFATPIIANGKVYVGSQLQVSAYGTISMTPTAATPTFSPAPGSYSSTITVTLSDSTSGATIHCTTDGSTPTAGSPTCSSVAISSTTTLKAIATANGYNPSNVASGTYTIDPGAAGINYGSGFTATGLTFNGTTKLNGTRLRLTDGGTNEAASAFISTPIGVQTFTTDFGFQLTSASGDGITFTIQGVGPTALGPSGGGLGYGPDTPGGTPGIANSIAVKFDIYSNAGEGTDSTGLYTDGASPTIPALDMTSSGVSLLSGDVFNVHATYDGTTLTMTITDASNSSQTFTASWPINIPATVGSSTAYVGFTGGTGGSTAIQEILDWTYVTSQLTAATPTFSPAPGTYSSPQSVTLSDTTPGAVIHCTTDGSTPTAGSPVCTTLTVSVTTTIKAIAVASGYNNSAVASGTYTITSQTAATPTFSPAPGTYNSPQSVTLSDTTPGAVIHCTTDGSTPTAGSPVCTTLTVSVTTTIKAIAVASGYNNSAVAIGTYTITLPTAATPTFSPAPGTYNSPQSVTLSDTTPGAVIHCTTDGSTPTAGSPVCTTLTVSVTTTIKAIAVASGYNNSAVASGTYTITSLTAATPTFSPAPGSYSSTITVTLSDSTSGATIHCTTDGSTPTAGSPTCSSVAISSTTTLKAIATANGYNPSNVASGTYTIDPGAAGINYGSGFTATGLTFNGTTKLNGTRLRLTDGGTHEAASAFISTPIGVQTFTTDFGFQLTSASGDGITFTIQGVGPTALGPSGGGLGYGPDTPGGTPGIANSIAVKFDIYSNAGEGTDSTGLYTDGASPTIPALDMTSSGVSLLSGDVFNVHATYDGTTLTMTITDASNSSQTFTASWPINIPATVGSSTAYVGFTGGTGGSTAIQEILDWTYVTSQLTAATPTFSPAPGTYSSPQSVTLSDTTPGAVIHCTTDGSTPTAGSPVCTTLTVSVTTTIKAIAVASGYNNSAVASGTYTITSQTAATPTFSPAPGTYNSPQSVTLSDTTPGAVIHCTTDGSTPTAGSPVCTTLTVSVTTTIKAIAVASGYNNSAVAIGTYTITTSGNPYVSYGAGFSSTGLALNGFAKLNGTRLRLTDGGATEAGSGYYTTPLNIQSFTTDFSFQLTNPNADGFTFVIQNAGTTALGPTGGGLGYGPDMPGGTLGIPASVAVKFDLYNNAGEGTNSTGLYTNGASPTIPSTTLGGNVNLHSGDVFNVHITYNGTALTMTITDATTTADTFTTSWTVNIPSTVGANTAYAGFTGGTSGETATQDILSWTFTSGAPGAIQYEATNIPVTGSPNARSFNWSGFPDGIGEIADGTAVGAYLNFTVNVATPGTYDIKAATKEFPTRGIFQLTVNGTNVGPTEDEYSNGGGLFEEYDLGSATFATAGNYSFKFTVTGHNSSSSGYTVCFDYIKLTPQ